MMREERCLSKRTERRAPPRLVGVQVSACLREHAKAWTPTRRRDVGALRLLVHFNFGGAYSGAIAPRLMMYLMPSATDMSSLVTLSSGTSTRNPDVGFGVVGMKIQTTFSF